MAYATVQQLTAWLGGESAVPSDADRLLDRASELIDTATVAAVYATDVDGQPTEHRVIDGLRDATCAQVEYWLETGDELGVAGAYGSVSIGSVTLSGSTRGGSGGSGPARLAPRARDVLIRAGLGPRVAVR